MLAVAILALSTALAGCYSYGGSSRPDTPSRAATCDDLLNAVIRSERTERGDIDSRMDALSRECNEEYDVAVGYLSAPRPGSVGYVDSCEELLEYRFHRDAVALLEQDGLCSFTDYSDGPSGSSDSPSSSTPEWPEDGLGWDHADRHVGTVQRVCGPLMSMRVTDDGTFVNVGRDYPSQDRFTFIFWDYYLDRIDGDAVICGRGEIYLYNGVTQMEMSDPGRLEIWR